MARSTKINQGTIIDQMIQELEESGELYIERAKFEIAEQIRKAMKQSGVSKAELARRLNKSRAYITQILQGDVNFTVESLIRIAESLGYKLDLKLNRKLEISDLYNFDPSKHNISGENKSQSNQEKDLGSVFDNALAA